MRIKQVGVTETLSGAQGKRSMWAERGCQELRLGGQAKGESLTR